MSWHFSQALVEEFSEAPSLDGEPFALWNTTPFAQGDSCSDKMRGICHRSPFGMMFVPLTDLNGAELLMWFREGFRAKHTAVPQQGKTRRMTSGRKCGESWQMSLPGTSLPRTYNDAQLIGQQMSLSRWVTASDAFRYQRQTWVLTTFGSGTGYLHTPTCTANYSAPSMQKWACAREFTRVFGRPSPINHEWLMGWPMGWSQSAPLAMDKFHAWQRAHGKY